MTDWYYHDPIEGRVGPLPTDELLTRYRDRRIQLDTLVWHAGLREWSALERQAEALDLHSVVPDPSLPPPVPRVRPSSPLSSHNATSTAYGNAATLYPSRPPKKGMSGCLIAVLVCGALAVPVVAILAAIALPAYQGYVVRSKVMAALAQASPVQAASEAYSAGNKSCARNGEGGIGAPRSYSSPNVASIESGTFENGHCGIAITLRGQATLEGKHLWLEQQGSASGVRWSCSSDMAATSLPSSCRTP